MLYLCMSFSILLIMLFGYMFYLSKEISKLNKKFDTHQTGSNKPVSSEQ